MKIFHVVVLAVLSSFLFVSGGFAQNSNSDADSVDLTVIDSYVSPDIPHTFTLTFLTGFNCKSKLIIDKKHEYKISDSLVQSHNIKVDLSSLTFKTKSVPYSIILEDSTGKKYQLNNYEFDLPDEVKIESESNFLLFCLFGGAVFALPAPTYVSQNGNNYFSLTKEIPLISLRSSNFTYPFGYFSAEYSYVFKAPSQNFFRLGYKEMITTPIIEYVSPGVNWFTTFNGFNGVSAELSLGLVKIFNTFTVYTRYRYNIQPGNSGNNFHEISVGLYSSFFSFYF